MSLRFKNHLNIEMSTNPLNLFRHFPNMFTVFAISNTSINSSLEMLYRIDFALKNIALYALTFPLDCHDHC